MGSITVLPAQLAAQTDAGLGNVDEQTPESFEKKEQSPEREKKGNILNIILDKTPAMSTERGTLVIDAYIDSNSNSLWDADEPDLKGEIICTIDDLDYPVPAFIPGLDYNARYKISCQGTGSYQPTASQKNVLIARRGQIIKMTIPCRKASPTE
ncbi:hypothetical protein [uncultured Desulfuromonas sp.]|uniref:hypothetical protein n=1 Tax=uncultured Desulfuromonas sp. TaxID=181013 RepID=UPI002AAB28BF|nr:hypothetical protein [uncultured Desulfuromonas sp.]